MKKQLKKLKLNKRTVQVLTKDEQNKVVGGGSRRCQYDTVTDPIGGGGTGGNPVSSGCPNDDDPTGNPFFTSDIANPQCL